MPQLNATGRKMPGSDEPTLVAASPWKKLPDKDNPPLLVSYKQLEQMGVFANRMDARRKQLQEGFPRSLELSTNKIAWIWLEVAQWLSDRPRRMPGSGRKNGANKPGATAQP